MKFIGKTLKKLYNDWSSHFYLLICARQVKQVKGDQHTLNSPMEIENRRLYNNFAKYCEKRYLNPHHVQDQILQYRNYLKWQNILHSKN